jgi:RNA polymerase sigma factor (TIGR02999 family)
MTSNDLALKGTTMDQEPDGELTVLLQEARAGRKDANDQLAKGIYNELRRVAAILLRRERADHTLQPSALVNEALVRLFGGSAIAEAPNRRYLFAAAGQAMRQVLVDHARRRRAAKRGGALTRVPLDEVLGFYEAQRLDILALNEALDRLMALNERQGLVVTLRFFAGLSVLEVAEALEVSVGTVESDWRVARAWLRNQLEEIAE